LWSEVIWRGGHDVLAEPYDPVHLRRALGLRQGAEATDCALRAASFQACA
jgi:hypothetical protein